VIIACQRTLHEDFLSFPSELSLFTFSPLVCTALIGLVIGYPINSLVWTLVCFTFRVLWLDCDWFFIERERERERGLGSNQSWQELAKQLKEK
jgi:hypothetical protein